ncbi:hypothetical protein BCR39DRAFT_535096 [Naematelia encephala]|uniref:Cytochrome b561 domain-containing protein n=1 Tax=Naematelia encephala TaxID=71784 RepID=A0A1Y2B127_9TREE|nr:hypothetical protein BCR39DRAFT_535096 [Naematelia encephala]
MMLVLVWLAALLGTRVVFAANTSNTSNSTITGQQICNPDVCVTALRNTAKKIDTYTLAPAKDLALGLSEFGWIAIGFGSQMNGSPMIITWPNSDGTFTLSQRQASGHNAPKVVSSPARKATLLSSSSFSNTSSTAITFTLPITSASTTSANSTKLIWAYGGTNPKSTSTSATIRQHNNMGTMSIDLLAAYSSTSSSSSSSSDSSSAGPSYSVMIAHAVMGGLATLLFFPVGVLIPRIARGFSIKRWWFPAHSVMNGIIGGVLVIAAFGLGVNKFQGGINSAHRKCGVALFILVILQIALGLGSHYYRPSRTIVFSTASGRGPSNFSHVALGLVVLALGWATAWFGIDSEWKVYDGKGLNVGWKVLWGLAVGITSTAYLVGIGILLPRQRNLEAQQRRQRRDQDLELSRAEFLKNGQQEQDSRGQSKDTTGHSRDFEQHVYGQTQIEREREREGWAGNRE